MKRGPGRPRLRYPRRKRICVFFTKGEYRTIRTAAKCAGVKRAGSFIRQMILHGIAAGKKEEQDG